MRILISRKLSWLQVKALILLVCGSIVTQLKPSAPAEASKASWQGCILVVVNAISAGIGGVYSEKLLKGKDSRQNESIHWQNSQLYIFGFLFGLVSLLADGRSNSFHILEGFNLAAYMTVFMLAACGLLVSFILKYLDNIAKCFVGALSMVTVALMHSAMTSEKISMHLSIGIVLTAMAIEQYNLS